LNGNASTASNAATLDSLDSTQFLRSDANDTASGDITFTGFVTFDNDASPAVKIVSDDFAEGLEIHRNHASNAPAIKFSNTSAQLGILYANSSEELIWRDGTSTNNNTIWTSGNDGSGSGLDADTVDGIQASSFLRSDATDSFTSISGTTVTADNVYIAGSLYHEGDTDTRLLFGTNTITLQTGGSSEITVNTTGVQLGDTGNGYFQPVTGDYGSIQIDGGAHGGWEGYSIGGRAGLFHNNSDVTILWDDVNNKYLYYAQHNGPTYMYYAGIYKLNTNSTGANIQGDLNAVDNIYLASTMYHEGDTNTFVSFGTDVVNIGTGGTSRVYVDNTGVRLGDTGNGYFQPVSGDYGSIQIDGGAHNSWEGYSIGGRAVFMHDNSTSMGLYDDVNNHWALWHAFNGETHLYYDGGTKLNTISTGANIDGDLNAVDNIYVANYIYHEGDTNSYLGWSAADDFRIVVGNRQILRCDEGANPDKIQFYDSSNFINTDGDFQVAGDITLSGSGTYIQFPDGTQQTTAATGGLPESTASTSSTSQTSIATYSTTSYGTIKLVISVKRGTARQSSEILIVHDGTTAFATEYAQINTGSELASFDVDISGGNVRLLATATSATTTNYTIAEILVGA